MLLSVHAVPSGLGGSEHFPLFGLQVPGSWHMPLLPHTTAEPVQVPPWHVSPVVHLFESSQAVLSGSLGGAVHVPLPGSHEPFEWH